MDTNKKIPHLKINIRNQSEETAIIDIDGEIGWFNEDGELNSARNIKNKLKEIDSLEASKIQVNINSLGGFVDDGLAIHDVLARHDAEIETHVIGMTASAATIIAQAGDKRFMSDNSLYLIHKAWGLVVGNANDMLAQAEDLKAIDKRILNIYTKRSSKSSDQIEELMNANDGGGKWIDADEALEAGLIDSIFEPAKAAAAIDPGAFNMMGLPKPKGYIFINMSNPEKKEMIVEKKPTKKRKNERLTDDCDENKNLQSNQESDKKEGSFDILKRKITLNKIKCYE